SPPLSVQQALTINTVAAAGRNDSIATATPLSNGTYSASLSPGDNGAGGYSPDRDYYVVTAKAGVTVTVDIRAQRLAPPSLMDSVVQILDANGNEFTTCRMTSQGAFDNFCTNDDLASGGSTDSYLEFQVPGVPGTPVTFYIRVLEWRGMARPDFVYTITIAGAN
ncbi:MAG TPA: hypothetical protein VNL38_00715, partial [Candidatus Nitrosotenuis sp.]|nr:hypothetical protein [Candidatus Nitrosotenuis sp.]